MSPFQPHPCLPLQPQSPPTPPLHPLFPVCASRTLVSSELPAQARVFLCGVGRHVLPSPRKVLTCPPYLQTPTQPLGLSSNGRTLLVPCTPSPHLNWSPPISSLSTLIFASSASQLITSYLTSESSPHRSHMGPRPAVVTTASPTISRISQT